MKKWMGFMVGLCWLGVLRAQDPGFRLEGIGSATVPVTINKMTNLVFPEAIQSGVKVSRDIMAQKVKGVENVLELKAARVGFVPTNLSVYGRDGRLYSFVLRYVEDTVILNYRVVVSGESNRTPVQLTGLPADAVKLREDGELLRAKRSFLRVKGKSDGLRLGLSGIWLRDSLQWLVFSLRNRSALPLRAERWRFFLQDRKAVKRKAVQEVGVEPVYLSSLPTISGKGKLSVAAGFDPFVVPAGKRLVVEVVGKDGRMARVRVKGRVFKRERQD
jgi:conjugative transposon TraN protein